MLAYLPAHFTAVVLGASGGIGRAIVEALLDSSSVGHIIAVSRSPLNTEERRLTQLNVDITTEAGRDALCHCLNGAPVHLLFNAVGTLHDASRAISPEKRVEDLTQSSLEHLLHVNAVAPALLIAALKPCLQGDHPTIVASLSARVGSIEDNRLGGWYSYRASKAAHNMLMKTLAIELARLNKQSIVLCLHPGTTATELSKPFQANVPADKLFTTTYVASQLLKVIDARTPEESGTFWDWAGNPVEW